MREKSLILIILFLTACTSQARQSNAKHAITDVIPKNYSGTWKVYNDDDFLISEENYYKGKRHGLIMQWYDNGQVMREIFYRNNLRNGVLTEWDDSGNKLRQVSYHKGLKSGISKEFNLQGKVIRRASFSEGKANGACYEFYDTGFKLREFHYLNGKRHGSYRQWDIYGKETFNKTYKKGILIKEPVNLPLIKNQVIPQFKVLPKKS